MLWTGPAEQMRAHVVRRKNMDGRWVLRVIRVQTAKLDQQRNLLHPNLQKRFVMERFVKRLKNDLK